MRFDFTARTECCGGEIDFADPIASITSISLKVLQGSHRLRQYSVAATMFWPAKPITKRKEDLAYYLLGMFDTGIISTYGEAVRALCRRLEEEIVKRNNDLAIFT
jgi:hypothetical protein